MQASHGYSIMEEGTSNENLADEAQQEKSGTGSLKKKVHQENIENALIDPVSTAELHTPLLEGEHVAEEDEHRDSIFGDLFNLHNVWRDERKSYVATATVTLITVARSEEMLVFDLFLSAGISIFNLCTITVKSPPIFLTLSIFAVSFTGFLAFQYCLLRWRKGRVVRNLVIVVRQWNHIVQLIVLIILVDCLTGDNTINDDQVDAAGRHKHHLYHCTELYYTLNFIKSIYHIVLLIYAAIFGEHTLLDFVHYTGKYFLQTFLMDRCKKVVVRASTVAY